MPTIFPFIDVAGLPAQNATDVLALKEDKANKNAANGYAPLDANAKVPVANLPAHSHAIADVTNLQTILDGKQASGSYELTSNRNAANGYAGLGADGKIALNQLPDANALESEAIAFAVALR